MQTYTSRRNLFGSLSGNTSESNKTLGDSLINEGDKKILNANKWDFLERTYTISTVASQQFYNLSGRQDSFVSVKVTIGTTDYTPKEAPTRKFWEKLNESSSTTSDTPEWFYLFNNQIGFYPKPSSSTANAITVTDHYKGKDLSIADYTTGTIVTATNAGTTIVGSGTSWTDKMKDMWIRITDSTTTNTGDGNWYQISSVTNATTLVLTRNYEGTSIVAGSANYTIGQCSLVPEEYQILPVYYALYLYFLSVAPDKEKRDDYKTLYNEGALQMLKDVGEKSTDPTIEDGDFYQSNPNLFIQL